MESFLITEEKLIITDHEDSAVLQLIPQENQDKVNEYRKKYYLPDDLFAWDHVPEVAPRFEKLPHANLPDAFLLVLTNIVPTDDFSPITDQFEIFTIVYSKDLLLCFYPESSVFFKNVIHTREENFSSLANFVGHCFLHLYQNYTKELQFKKKCIDKLDQAARDSTSNEELFRLTDTTRNMVYLENALETLDLTVQSLAKQKDFMDSLNDQALAIDIQMYNRQTVKLVHLYRDLLETISGLFSDMMSNHLNHLMKFLESTALVISVPTLIGGFWGMNTGGLPGRHHGFGFWLVVMIAGALALIMALFLKKKNYFK
ncbi:magnesium transporter CorA family protein [Enterococcus timonensis]|uniref:magnesium transporter CorA family protein n=1 Tax=Enterococcus timonensis TaxID=1852364 RepID=UPI0009F1F8F8|nr:magnesium transporter CorA family protein [Enterococcus timonensis]